MPKVCQKLGRKCQMKLTKKANHICWEVEEGATPLLLTHFKIKPNVGVIGFGAIFA